MKRDICCDHYKCTNSLDNPARQRIVHYQSSRTKEKLSYLTPMLWKWLRNLSVKSKCKFTESLLKLIPKFCGKFIFLRIQQTLRFTSICIIKLLWWCMFSIQSDTKKSLSSLKIRKQKQKEIEEKQRRGRRRTEQVGHREVPTNASEEGHKHNSDTRSSEDEHSLPVPAQLRHSSVEVE